MSTYTEFLKSPLDKIITHYLNSEGRIYVSMQISWYADFKLNKYLPQ